MSDTIHADRLAPDADPDLDKPIVQVDPETVVTRQSGNLNAQDGQVQQVRHRPTAEEAADTRFKNILTSWS